MDTRWERRPPPLPPPQRARDYASFSASLLDAIYRSLDAPDTHTEPEPDPAPPPMKPRPAEFWWAPQAASAAAASRRAESPRPRPVRANRNRNRIRPAPPPPPPPPPPIETKSAAPKPRSIRSRLRELRKGRGSSSSSPLASLLKALFTSAGHVNKTKIPAQEPEPEPEPACSSARSCLSARRGSAAVTPPKRSVRFHPVSVIVGEDSRPCGHQRLRHAAEESSDSSSDLFELENLTSSTGLRDESPVYESTMRFAVSLPAAPPSTAVQTSSSDSTVSNKMREPKFEKNIPNKYRCN